MRNIRHTRVCSSMLFVALLAGCSDERPRPLPPVEVRTVTVEKPVPVPCVDKAAVPTLPGKVGSQLTGDAPHDLDIVSAALIRMRAIADQAISMLGACAK